MDGASTECAHRGPDLRIRLPRRQLRHDGYAVIGAGGRESWEIAPNPLRAGATGPEPIARTENLQVARHGFDPAVEVWQVELLVRRVEVIVWQAESHHHA